MRRIGAHVSIAGGVGSAPYRQYLEGGTCGQIFVSSPRSWAVKLQSKDESDLFKSEREKYDQTPYAVHCTYLINLGTANGEVLDKSMITLQNEIISAHELGIEYVVFHPGAATSGISKDRSIAQVGRCLSKLTIPDGVKLLLENTAGKGSTLGRTFSELSQMIRISSRGYDSLGVCLDTCHAFCGGYALHTDDGMSEMLDDITATIGIENVCIMHLNDSKHPFDSRKDEHEHIGLGHIGDDGMRTILHEKSFCDVPLVLETPVSQDRGYAWNISKTIELIDE